MSRAGNPTSVLRSAGAVRALVSALIFALIAGSSPASAEAPPHKGGAEGAHAYVQPGVRAPRSEIMGGKGQVTFFFESPAGGEAAMSLLVLQPGAEVPQHIHEKSFEYLYVLEGEAEMVVAGETFRIGQEDAVRIPLNTPHRAKVVGTKAFRALQVYNPGGPEQRFKAPPPAPAR